MLAQERQNIIVDMLREKKTLRVTELTERFGASLATIRRDLETLESQGAIRRVYGGAVLNGEPARVQTFFSDRKNSNNQIKAAIGRAAADLVREGETVFLDIGTTTLEVARHLKGFRKLTVLTNSLPILNDLADSGLDVFSLGGRLRPDELCFAGEIAAENLRGFFVDKAFLSVGGITLAEGLSDFSHSSVQMHRLVLERAGESVLVADSGKFGNNTFAIIGGLDLVDIVITDEGIPAEYAAWLRAHDVRLVTVRIA